MTAEAGHHASRSYTDRSGNQHLNGGALLNDAEEDVSSFFDNRVVEDALPLILGKVWDAVGSNLPTAGANDDLGLLSNTFGTTAPTIESGDSKAATTTRRCLFAYAVRPEYVDGQAITLRLNAGMKTTVSDTTATIDAEVYRVAAPTVDICATAATTINSLTAGNVDFTLTPTNVVAGDILLIRITVAIVDSATGTAVIGQLNKVSVRPTIKF